MKKILVIRFSSLGDVILASSVIKPLYERGFHIDFLTLKPFDQMFRYDIRVNSIGVNKTDVSGKNLIQFRKKLTKYDIILDLHKNLRSHLLTLLSGKKVIRYKKNSLKRRLYLIKTFRKILESDFNVVNSYTETLKKLHIKVSYPKPEIVITSEEKERFKNKLPENLITLGTGSQYRGKVYKDFKKISDILLNLGYNVALIGTEEDKRFDVEKYSNKVIDLRGKLNLRESLTVISLSKLTISNDSAVAHMSRAVNTPVTVIYGATDPYFGFVPLDYEGNFIHKGLDCQPCDLHGKKDCKFNDYRCLDIPPEEIVDKGLSLIR